ncbi:unnamed protein product [Kuraishia capsulata CBS 1993]|uniref:Partial AB-hydrolase lipase domain-containing protein n=1 Tax=Kuraishia capsulata CBS 1993 TaxID=1382522 RepID=W6MKZ7_9ASCO|nr:uncharacterized protein KUCA_T00003073001 [Kuraishia capsulata CBS 1993]CDK27096.1 unnamed protein product [Kuraishia capsulata CBS 1993]
MNNAKHQGSSLYTPIVPCSHLNMSISNGMMSGFLATVVVVLESFISFVTFLLPKWLIRYFTRLTRVIFRLVSDIPLYSKDPIYDAFIKEMGTPQNEEEDKDDQDSDEQTKPQLYATNGSATSEEATRDDTISLIKKLKNARSIKEMCSCFGYKVQDYLVTTQDGYLLTLHRIMAKKPHSRTGKVVYMQHGLLMSSEIWVTMYKERLNLPFVLTDLGFDVWLGNNRGNKYSCRHLTRPIDSEQFWNFSIDEYSMFDIPDSIDYILKQTGQTQVNYVGFSQGCTQGLAATSLNRDLNDKIDKMILISPATTPHGLSNPLINSIINLSPEFMFLLFGKKIILKSAYFWRDIIYPPLFIKVIDWADQILFNWKSENINYMQKFVSYYHLYSTTSVKSAVHWFQIIKSKRFQMYDANKNSSDFQTFQFPIENGEGSRRIMVLFGTSDSLVDIQLLQKQLGTIEQIVPIENHEHLDLVWGTSVDTKIAPPICEFLKPGGAPDKDK